MFAIPHVGLSRAARIAGVVVAVGAAAIVLLAIRDYRLIGSVPAPCLASGDHWHAGMAVVPSGAPRLRRSKAAVAAWRNAHVAGVLFSGAGHGGDSARRVAKHAQDTLGLVPAATWIEPYATSTYENFRYACRLPAMRTIRRIAIASDPWHLARSYATAQRQCPGRSVCSLPAADHSPPSDQRRRSETWKLLAYQLTGRAALLP